MMAFLFTRDVIAINKITKNSHNTTYHLVGITERRVHLKGNYEDWIGDIEILMKMPEIYSKLSPKQYAVLSHIYAMLKENS